MVAQELGLKPDAVAAGVRPEQRRRSSAGFRNPGPALPSVGDGLNDGPRPAQADLGIAVTQATDVAKEAADILLLKSDLGAIPRALDLAQTTTSGDPPKPVLGVSSTNAAATLSGSPDFSVRYCAPQPWDLRRYRHR